MKHLLLSILFLAAVGISTAQTTGKISYLMDFSSDDPEMAMSVEMLQGSTMDLYFIPEKTRIDMVMGTFIKVATIVDVQSGKGLLLSEVMAEMTATEIKDISATEEENNTAQPELKETSEKKKIIGYKCIKMISTDAEGNETIMWIAKDLQATLKGHQLFENINFSGIPLEFSSVRDGMAIHFIATKFEKEVDNKIFSLEIPEGYTLTVAE